MKNATLEEILAKWQGNLDAHVKEFHHQAKIVSKWDQTLIENAHQIALLTDQMTQTQALHKELDQNLDYIESQQGEMSQLLESLDHEVNNLSAQIGNPAISHIDDQRQKSYELSETLNKQLNEMVFQLNQIVEEVNSSSKRDDNLILGKDQESSTEDPTANTNPINDIVKILNVHLDSLQAMEKYTDDLKDRLSSLSAKTKVISQDQARLLK